MNEKDRLQEVFDYRILDTPFEAELDELALIASAICDTPIALLTILDDKRMWFKAKLGLEIEGTHRKDSFCQHALHKPKEVLVVEDATKDRRFDDSVLVSKAPFIRFYAGAPIATPNGHVLGTICVMDSKPGSISESKKKALQIMAKRVMKYLDHRKLILEQKNYIGNSAEKLKKLTDLSPGVIYQFQVFQDGKIAFNFISEGISLLHPGLDPELIKHSPELAFSIIHPEDLDQITKDIKRSFNNLTDWTGEYRAVSENGLMKWHSAKAKPEKQEDGSVIWYGTIQDITNRKEYEMTMEQIAFDISHVLRRPITTLLGLVSLYDLGEVSKENSKLYAAHIKSVSEELDKYTKKLNVTYSKKREIISGENDS